MWKSVAMFGNTLTKSTNKLNTWGVEWRRIASIWQCFCFQKSTSVKHGESYKAELLIMNVRQEDHSGKASCCKPHMRWGCLFSARLLKTSAFWHCFIFMKTQTTPTRDTLKFWSPASQSAAVGLLRGLLLGACRNAESWALLFFARAEFAF